MRPDDLRKRGIDTTTIINLCYGVISIDMLILFGVFAVCMLCQPRVLMEPVSVDLSYADACEPLKVVYTIDDCNNTNIVETVVAACDEYYGSSWGGLEVWLTRSPPQWLWDKYHYDCHDLFGVACNSTPYKIWISLNASETWPQDVENVTWHEIGHIDQFANCRTPTEDGAWNYSIEHWEKTY